jgi:hypothetical protein
MGESAGFKQRQSGDAAQQPGEHECNQHHGRDGDDCPGKQRLAGEPTHLSGKSRSGSVQQSAGLDGRLWLGCGEPTAEADKGHNQQQLKRHHSVVCRLNGRQIEAQRQGQRGAEQRGNADHWNAADGESERKRESQASWRDALTQSHKAIFRLIESN